MTRKTTFLIALTLSLLVGCGEKGWFGRAGGHHGCKHHKAAACQGEAQCPAACPSEKATYRLIIRHKVADFAKWIPVYDEHEQARREASIYKSHAFQDESDPSTVVVIGRVVDLEKAKVFIASDTLKDAMKRAGVVGEPTIWIVQEPGQ